MRVETLYTDSSGAYRVSADVTENNRYIHIIKIVDDQYDHEVFIDDFSEEELKGMYAAVLEEYEALDSDPSDDYDEADNDEEDESDY